MPTITTVQKAPILDETGTQLTQDNSSVTSSDPSIVGFSTVSRKWFASAGQPGTATVTATRTADGATASAELTVVAPAVPFAITFGPAVAK